MFVNRFGLELGFVIDSIEVYILKLVEMTEVNWCAGYLSEVSIDLTGLWYTVETQWSDDSHM